MHIVNEDVAFLSDTECSRERKEKWYPLYKQMLKRYEWNFEKKKIDFWIYLGDNPEKAYWAVKLKIIKSDNIFAFVTMKGMESVVIPVPDYMYYEFSGGGGNYDECIKKYKKCSKFSWKCEKAFWIGNLSNHSSREKLYLLGKTHLEDLEIRAFDWSNLENFVPYTELYQYKYLIDVRGCAGWSDRLQVLVHLGRVIFVNERDCIQFWMMYGWEAGKHYISVREDFSDLVEKKKELDLFPWKYRKIVEEMHFYAEKFLTKDFALKYLKNTILKYAV